jgi:hypothetical protein
MEEGNGDFKLPVLVTEAVGEAPLYPNRTKGYKNVLIVFPAHWIKSIKI